MSINRSGGRRERVDGHSGGGGEGGKVRAGGKSPTGGGMTAGAYSLEAKRNWGMRRSDLTVMRTVMGKPLRLVMNDVRLGL